MSTTSRIIEFYRESFRLDNRDNGILSLYSKKIAHRIFFKGDEQFGSGMLESDSFFTKAWEKFHQDSLLYAKEKVPTYMLFAVTGTCGGEKITAPLLYYPGKLRHEGELFHFDVNVFGAQVNWHLLERIAEEQKLDINWHDVMTSFPEAPWQATGSCLDLERLLREFKINCDCLTTFPELTTESAFKKRKPHRGFKLHNVAAAGLLTLNRGSREILDELGQIVEKGSNDLLDQLLTGESDTIPEATNSIVTMPVELNPAQIDSIKKSQTQRLSVVIGPPGTGKSHTIAAMALDHFMRGEKVLLVSRSDEALKVIEDKFDKILGYTDVIQREGKTRGLSNHLERIVNGIYPFSDYANVDIDTLQDSIDEAHKEYRRHRKKLERAIQSETKHDLVTKTRSLLYNLFASNNINYNQTLSAMWQARDRRKELVAHLIKALLFHDILKRVGKHKSQVIKFRRALRSRRASRRHNLWEEIEFRELLDILPVWSASLDRLGSVLPLEKDLFDLVIFDEASQVNVASGLPALYRSKRAAIVGDPFQLRHVSFLAGRTEAAIVRNLGLEPKKLPELSYRENSLLDVAVRHTSSEGSTFLNEHFRSLPQIIRFSNKTFYGNQLRYMRQTSNEQAIDWQRVAQKKQKAGTKQDAKVGRNSKEADAIIKYISRCATAQENQLYKSSIGVISPFREQVEYLRSRLSKALPLATLEQHRVIIGTAYAFQGEERDEMLVSLAATDQSHPAAFRFMERPDVFNVMITRARNRQTVLHSFDPARLSSGGLWHRYFTSCAVPEILPNTSAPDAFASEVVSKIKAYGIEARRNVRIAGIDADIAITTENRDAVIIDIIGGGGATQAGYSVDKYKILSELGFPVILVSYNEWQQRPEQILYLIKDTVASISSG